MADSSLTISGANPCFSNCMGRRPRRCNFYAPCRKKEKEKEEKTILMLPGVSSTKYLLQCFMQLNSVSETVSLEVSTAAQVSQRRRGLSFQPELAFGVIVPRHPVSVPSTGGLPMESCPEKPKHSVLLAGCPGLEAGSSQANGKETKQRTHGLHTPLSTVEGWGTTDSEKRSDCGKYLAQH